MPGFFPSGSIADPGIDSNAEYNRVHRWVIESLGFPGPPSSDRLRLHAKSIGLPTLKFEEEKIKGGSSYYKIAKRAHWEDITVKFYDVFGLYKVFKEWQDKIWTPADGIKKPSDYKGAPVFLLLDGEGNEVQRFTLSGAYPSKIDHGDLSYENSTIKLLTVTYTYDFAIIDADVATT